MPDKPHYTAAQMIAALHECKGMVFLAARRLGCSPQTIANYCKRYPSVQAAKDAERGELIDTAELKLWQSVEKGEAWGISLVLKTLGKERGYVERTEHTGNREEPIGIRVQYETSGLSALLQEVRKAERASHQADPSTP
jgi:hypothetical protein